MVEANAITIRHTVRNKRGDRMQAVKPATGLVNRLANVVGWKVAVEGIMIFKRIVPLGIRHCARVKPTVDNFGYALVCTTIVGMLKNDVVYCWSMQINFPERSPTQRFQLCN